MQNEYINEFYRWFVNKFSKIVYSKMGVFELSSIIDDKETDLVLIIDKKCDIIEVQSNYFKDKSASFVLSDIGVVYEKYRMLA